MVDFLKRYSSLITVFSGVLLFTTCANVASPSGGDYDLDPPKVVRTTPGFNATNVTSRKVEIIFDENVVVEKPTEKVIIAPPQKISPVIRSVNRKVTVELRDTLLENTTYTIDFTDAIADNNEKNLLEGFSFSFSTGDVVDSLAISGKVLTADNLEPVKGIYVGLHSNLSDTAFTKTKFERISKANDKGEFTIRGIAPGRRYKLYALDDINREYMYNNPGVAIAFLDTIIEPATALGIHQDTVFTVKNNKKTVDTIVDVNFTRFLPDNIVLRTFVSSFRRHYLQKHERSNHKAVLYFGAPSTMPIIEPLSFDKNKDWAILEKTVGNDTLTYWIKDPAIMAMDSLFFKVSYLKTDTLNQDVMVIDTLNFMERGRKKPKDKKKNKKKGEEEEIVFLSIKNNVQSTWDIFNNISLEFEEPVDSTLSENIKLQQLVDTTYNDVDFEVLQDSINPRKYVVKRKWNYGESYKLSIDSAAVHSMYGLWNDKLEQKFAVRKLDEYGVIVFSVSGFGTSAAFIELLNKSDVPVRKVNVRNGRAVFRNLVPGEYYARIILDENKNGKWDTGDYHANLQPEMVCYFDEKISVRPYWEDEKAWVVDVAKLATQKPLDITKNKPDKKESKREQLEKQDSKKERDQEEQRKRERERNGGRGSGRTTSSSEFPSY